jgi:phosphoribosyl-ATP pyrophosphohydrolase
MDIVQNELKEESNELLFHAFSTIFKDQLNVPDVNEILDTQRQM